MKKENMEISRCFEILELDRNASLEEAKQAYRDQVKFFHPDRFANDPRQREKAEKKLKDVNEAYERVKVALASKEKSYSVIEAKETVREESETRGRPVYRDVQQEVETKDKGRTGMGTEIIRSVGSFLFGMLRRTLESQIVREKGGQGNQEQGKGMGTGKGFGRGRGRGRGRGKGRGGR